VFILHHDAGSLRSMQGPRTGAAMPFLRMLPLLLAHPGRVVAAAAAAADELVVPAWDAKMEFQERCIEVANDAMSTPGQPRNFTNNSRWSFWSLPEGQAPPGGWPVLIQLAIIPYPAGNATAPHCGMDGYNPPDSSGPWLAEQQQAGQNAHERRSQERRRAKAHELALAAAHRRAAVPEHTRPYQPLLPPELRERVPTKVLRMPCSLSPQSHVCAVAALGLVLWLQSKSSMLRRQLLVPPCW
jgi:hypothetical protein